MQIGNVNKYKLKIGAQRVAHSYLTDSMPAIHLDLLYAPMHYENCTSKI